MYATLIRPETQEMQETTEMPEVLGIPETHEITAMPDPQKKDLANEEENVCIIEYDERSLGHAFISKVYYQGGVDISIRFVKQKTSSNGQIYDPGTAPAGIQRQVVKLVIKEERETGFTQ